MSRPVCGHTTSGSRFPRRSTGALPACAADLHFAPTEAARTNLLHEGVSPASIVVTGNPVIDALQYVAAQPEPESIRSLLQIIGLAPDTHTATGGQRGRIASREPGDRALCLVTAHRRESFGAPLERICAALKDLAARGDLEIVYPVHPNPNVHEPVHRLLEGIPHITLLPPMDYLPLVHLMKRATIILTDSVGFRRKLRPLAFQSSYCAK